MPLEGETNFKGLKKSEGDFKHEDGLLRRWKKNDPYLFYTCLQNINPVVFNLIKDAGVRINIVWIRQSEETER